MIKAIILILCLMDTVLCANEPKEHKHLPYDVAAALLQSIDSDALILGSGKKVVYVFIDPLCKHSRKFISMVSKNPIMLSKYQYHLLLYSIPRMQSTDVVSAVYMSENPIETLLKIMIEEKLLYDIADEVAEEKINRIATVAQEIDVYKRPYIFIMK